ncbi:ABC transporter substrate-binding protein [Variovorax sp. M-6]|uniref:ABC transporter substrate-binding protein n=1 Tax=Variovorax sp. M-6 TaxID=3233041 RepID=UPI003F9B44C1
MITATRRRCLRASATAWALGAALLLGLAGGNAAAADHAPAVDRDTLVVGLEKSISNLDAQVTSTGDSLLYAWQIYDTLYGFDPLGNLVPRMASAVKVAPDQKSYAFTMRRGLRFQNGDPLTAQDVKYSLERILDPATKSTRRVYFAPVVERVEASGDTVTFVLKQPDGAFLNKVAGFLFIVPKDYTTRLGTPEAFAAAPIGSGPFRVKEFKVGQYLELERFDAYWGKDAGETPGVKRLVLRFIPEAASRVNALVNGEIDLATVIPLQDASRLKADKGLEVVTNPNGGPLHVRLYSNVATHPFANRDVRRALNHAVDSNAIIKGVLHGVGSPMASFISRYYPYGAEPDLKPYAYDPAKARELLRKAGFPNGIDVKLYNGTDQPKELAEAIAAYWGQVGVRTELVRMDYPAFIRLNNTHKAGPATVTIFSNVIYDPVHPIVGTFSKEGTWSDYYNPEVEALIGQLEGTLGPEARGAIFRKIGRLLHEDAASLNISEQFYVYGLKKGLQWQVQQGSGFLNFRRTAWQ